MINKKGHVNFKAKSFVLLVLALVFSISLISSAGVASSYWDDNPLKLAPGESTTISLRLQNEEDEQITMGVFLDSEIASLIDGTEYNVPPGRVSVPVYIKVSIPKDASIGTEYIIPVSFKQIASGEGGMLRVAQGITGKVPIEVVGEKESELYSGEAGGGLSLTWIIVGVLVLVILIFIFAARRKRKKKK